VLELSDGLAEARRGGRPITNPGAAAELVRCFFNGCGVEGADAALAAGVGVEGSWRFTGRGVAGAAVGVAGRRALGVPGRRAEGVAGRRTEGVAGRRAAGVAGRRDEDAVPGVEGAAAAERRAGVPGRHGVAGRGSGLEDWLGRSSTNSMRSHFKSYFKSVNAYLFSSPCLCSQTRVPIASSTVIPWILLQRSLM